MNYIYDILLNLNTSLYDFYEWDMDDEIMHVRRIPVFKVNTEVLFDLGHYQICLSSDFLSKLYRKSEIFTDKNTKTLEYVALFSDGQSVIGVEFNETGLSVKKSRLLIDEEEEVLEVVLRMQETDICYNILKKEPTNFKTRNSLEREFYLKEELEALKNDVSIGKLKYLYYECFNEKMNEKGKMIKRLERALEENSTGVISKMHAFFKLTSLHR